MDKFNELCQLTMHLRERWCFQIVLEDLKMYRKLLFSVLFTAALLFAGSAASIAQTSPVRGEVKMKKADGTMVPVEGAVVDSYRTDVGKGSGPSATTNNKGQFNFVGFVPSQTYALAVSGTGIGPRIEPGVKAGRENIVIVVDEGDGRKLTEAEVREVLASAANIPAGGLSAAQKKQQEELAKKNAEITEKNKKVQEGDAIASKANSEGIAALKAKNYEAAIAKFDEGVAAVPDFVGSTPVMLNGKMVAHKARAYDTYKEGAASADAALRKSKYEAANKDYDAGLAAFAQAMTVIKNAPAATDPTDQKNRASITAEILSNAMEIHRLKAVGGVDTTKGKEAAEVFGAYIAVETDPAKKLTAEMTLGDVLRETGDCDAAIVAYKKILATTPDNADALAGAGLCLFSVGYGNSDKAQMQEGLNYMQKFSDIAPDTHRLKSSVKDAVDLLKNEQKLAPQKVTTTKKKT